MRRIAISGLTAALALVFIATGFAWTDGRNERRSPGFSPEGAFCAKGPVFEKVRSLPPTARVDGLGNTKLIEMGSLTGTHLTKVKFAYESQPAVPRYIETVAGSFPPEVVYMAEQFKPNRRDAWIRVDFNVMVSVTPPPGAFAGLAYALYVKEDGGDGIIENPGVMTCGGDDTCGYLEQTYDAPWLVATNNELASASVARSDFFRVRGTRKIEVQVHLFPIHESGYDPVDIVVRFGLMAFSNGMRW